MIMGAHGLCVRPLEAARLDLQTGAALMDHATGSTQSEIPVADAFDRELEAWLRAVDQQTYEPDRSASSIPIAGSAQSEDPIPVSAPLDRAEQNDDLTPAAPPDLAARVASSEAAIHAAFDEYRTLMRQGETVRRNRDADAQTRRRSFEELAERAERVRTSLRANLATNTATLRTAQQYVSELYGEHRRLLQECALIARGAEAGGGTEEDDEAQFQNPLLKTVCLRLRLLRTELASCRGRAAELDAFARDKAAHQHRLDELERELRDAVGARRRVLVLALLSVLTAAAVAGWYALGF